MLEESRRQRRRHSPRERAGARSPLDAGCGHGRPQPCAVGFNEYNEGMMKRILLTGMSGTGKSSVIAALRMRGYPAVDMDESGWSEHAPDGDWIWREDRVRELLQQEHGNVLFLSGCATNQGQFYPHFNAIVLLSAPAAVLIERLTTRTNNPYGKRPEEQAEVLGYLETVEPLLRRGATHEIDTRLPLDQVVAKVLEIADEKACSRQ